MDTSLSRVVNRLKLKMTALGEVYAICRLHTRSSGAGSGISGTGVPGPNTTDSGAPDSSVSGPDASGGSNFGQSVPSWVRGEFWSITQTPDELSIVCPQECVPSGVLHEGGWKVLKVLGPLSFELTAIMASISSILAEAGTSIFALSTYDTDYILVKAEQLQSAIEALRSHGIEFV